MDCFLGGWKLDLPIPLGLQESLQTKIRRSVSFRHDAAESAANVFWLHLQINRNTVRACAGFIMLGGNGLRVHFMHLFTILN